MSSRSETSRQGLQRKGHPPIRIGSDELLAFACVRNEEFRLPYFLDYHRSLGIDRFFVVDNGSEDGTLEYLLSQPDVHAFFTRDSYAASKCGVTWINELLNRYGTGHWTLTVDADELLVYPECERISLRELTRHLDHIRAHGLVTFLLDMYSDKPIKDVVYRRGTRFQELCPYFDWDTFHEKDSDGIPVRGGARHRLFWAGRDRTQPSPVLKKIPLVRWHDGFAFEASTHIIRNVRLAPATGALLHFKFFADFYAYAEQEARRKEHWDDAGQYACYWNVLREDPDLSAFHEGSIRYRNSTQLVELGLMKESAELEEFAKQKAGSTERSR